ncbi:hypothetical protein GQ600_9076 [Phytophthora cactorum]|nr:hypothetical protein GQ600_9076 [Phytophthora cactorum]
MEDPNSAGALMRLSKRQIRGSRSWAIRIRGSQRCHAVREISRRQPSYSTVGIDVGRSTWGAVFHLPGIFSVSRVSSNPQQQSVVRSSTRLSGKLFGVSAHLDVPLRERIISLRRQDSNVAQLRLMDMILSRNWESE